MVPATAKPKDNPPPTTQLQTMNFKSWRAAPTALPRAQTCSSSQTVKIDCLGNGLQVVEPWSVGVKRVLWRYQRFFYGAGALLCASAAIGGRWGSPTRGVVGAAVLAIAHCCAEETAVVPDFVEAVVAEALGMGGNVVIGDKKASDMVAAGGAELQGNCRFAREWSIRLRLHFGETRDTAADRIVYKRWLAEEMGKADVRYTDQAEYIPLVVELALMPDIHSLEGEFARRTRVAVGMKAAVPIRPA